MVKFIVIVFLICCNHLSLYAKGMSGFYTLKGYAIDNKGDTIKNDTIFLKTYYQTDTIISDDKGKFEVKILWRTPCPSGRTEKQRQRDRKRANVKMLRFVYRNQSCKVINDWHVFIANNLEWGERKSVINKDLKFR